MRIQKAVFKGILLPYLLLLPQMIIIVVFFFWPAGQALMQSMFMQDPFGISKEFVGFENFENLFKNPEYLSSVGISFTFSFFVAGTALTVSLFLAMSASHVYKGELVYKTLIIWPYAVAGVLWMFLFNPTVGVVAWLLRQMGVTWNYLLDPIQAFALVVLAASWKQISYNFLFFIAGLQNIPNTLVEAAAIDGAGPTRRFWKVIFPLLSPTTFYLLVMNIIFSFFETFGIIHQVTQGGPGQATNIMVYKVYKDGYLGLDLGSSSAQSVILMIIVIVLTVLQFRFVERKVEY